VRVGTYLELDFVLDIGLELIAVLDELSLSSFHKTINLVVFDVDIVLGRDFHAEFVESLAAGYEIRGNCLLFRQDDLALLHELEMNGDPNLISLPQNPSVLQELVQLHLILAEVFAHLVH
jgi:hypothetical protein